MELSRGSWSACSRVGWRASSSRGGGYGILGDVLVGLVGSCIGGFLFSFFVDGVMGFWGSILVAFLARRADRDRSRSEWNATVGLRYRRFNVIDN